MVQVEIGMGQFDGLLCAYFVEKVRGHAFMIAGGVVLECSGLANRPLRARMRTD